MISKTPFQTIFFRNLNLDVVNSTKPVLSAVFECNIKLEQRIAEEKNKVHFEFIQNKIVLAVKKKLKTDFVIEVYFCIVW